GSPGNPHWHRRGGLSTAFRVHYSTHNAALRRERARPRPAGWRRGAVAGWPRSGPPESGTPLEERRIRRAGDGAVNRQPPPVDRTRPPRAKSARERSRLSPDNANPPAEEAR